MSADLTAGGLLGAAASRVRARPRALVGPFVLAGVVLAVTGTLRAGDPVPVVTRAPLQSGSVHVALPFHPAGTSLAATEPGALVGLRPAYLLWVGAVGLVEWAAVAVAGLVVLAEAGGWRLDRGVVVAYGGYVLVVRFVTGLTWFDVEVGLLVGVATLLAAFWVATRLFALPALLVAGRSPAAALRGSAGVARGNGVSLAAVVAGLGLVAHALASVPTVGTALSHAVVGPVSAVASALVAGRLGVGPGGHAPEEAGGPDTVPEGSP